MPPKKHFLIAAAVGLAAGFILANAKTGTGIYNTSVGQTLANVYMAGAKLTRTPASAVTAPATAS